MSFNVIFGQASKLDIEQACHYYDGLQPNLSDAFLADVVSAASSLEINPFFQVRYKDYRILPVQKFPYILIYWVDEAAKIVNIISVFHTSQDPNKYP
jgi:toxin ParE1/3/4